MIKELKTGDPASVDAWSFLDLVQRGRDELRHGSPDSAAELFSTGYDEANRAAVRAVGTEELDLVGIGVRAPHRDADAILRGLRRHG